MSRVLQFEDVYTRDDLAKGLSGMRGTPAMSALREEVAACRAREGGMPVAVAEADADVQADREVGDASHDDMAPLGEDLDVQTASVLPGDDVEEDDESAQDGPRRRRASTPNKRSRAL
jgi:hypothetical protein